MCSWDANVMSVGFPSGAREILSEVREDFAGSSWKIRGKSVGYLWESGGGVVCLWNIRGT